MRQVWPALLPLHIGSRNSWQPGGRETVWIGVQIKKGKRGMFDHPWESLAHGIVSAQSVVLLWRSLVVHMDVRPVGEESATKEGVGCQHLN